MIGAIAAIQTPPVLGPAPTAVVNIGNPSIQSNGTCVIVFSVVMDPATLTTSTIKLYDETASGYVTITSITPSFDEVTYLVVVAYIPNVIAGNHYHVEITTGAKSAVGVSLAAPYTSQSMLAFED